MTSMVPVLNAAFNSVTAQQCNGWIEHGLLYIYSTFEYVITHVYIYIYVVNLQQAYFNPHVEVGMTLTAIHV